MVEPQPALAGNARTVWVEVDLAEAVAGEGERRRGDEAGEDELLDPGGAVEPGVEPARSWCSDDTVGLSLMLACRRRGGTSEQSSERGAPLGSHRESRTSEPVAGWSRVRVTEPRRAQRQRGGGSTGGARNTKGSESREGEGEGSGYRPSPVKVGSRHAVQSSVSKPCSLPRAAVQVHAREGGGGAATREAGLARSRRRSLLRRQPAPPVKVFSSAIEL